MDGGDTEPAALEATHLGKRYRRDRAWALRDINLVVSEGSVVALVGPNGAGKTTLIRCFMGFEAADEGSVRVAGIDPKKDKASALQRVGYVGQEAALYRDLTVGDHLLAPPDVDAVEWVAANLTGVNVGIPGSEYPRWLAIELVEYLAIAGIAGALAVAVVQRRRPR